MNLHQKGPLSSQTQEEEDMDINNDADDYYVYIYDKEEEANNQMKFNNKRSKSKDCYLDKSYNRILAFWCFNAGICFKEIQKLEPKSIILTSGTLTPMDSFQAELQLDFKHRIENLHVINSD